MLNFIASLAVISMARPFVGGALAALAGGALPEAGAAALLSDRPQPLRTSAAQAAARGTRPYIVFIGMPEDNPAAPPGP